MVSPGNHESECHIARCALQHKEYGLRLNNFTAYNSRWGVRGTLGALANVCSATV